MFRKLANKLEFNSFGNLTAQHSLFGGCGGVDGYLLDFAREMAVPGVTGGYMSGFSSREPSADEEEDLQRAIQESVSLAKTQSTWNSAPSRSSSKMIVIENSDSEDEPVKPARALSTFREPIFSDDENDADFKAAVRLSLQAQTEQACT